jgi:hypothetical protein
VDVAEEFGLDIQIREVAEGYFIKNNAVWESENPESMPKRDGRQDEEEENAGKEDSGDRLSAASGERATFRMVDFSF